MKEQPDESRLTYGNFNNPLGLVWRMLCSGNRAAYSALFREALAIGLKPIDFLLAMIERREKDDLDESESEQPIVLIVGPPRSGTTLIYQVLAHCLDVSYASNLVGLFPRSPLTATRLLGRFVPGRPTADFRSYFGQSARLSGVHDGFFIWNQWLGEDRYAPRADLCQADSTKMRGFFARWTSKFSRPFLNKNNRNTACIDTLAHTLPNACFLVVRRDLAAIIRSLIRAREQVQGDKRSRWGLLSREANTDELGYVDDVCQQVFEIERRIEEQLESVDSSRVIEVTYEDFCDSPKALMDNMVERVPGLNFVPNVQVPARFTCSTGKRLSDAEEDRLGSNLIARSQPR